MYTNTGSVLTVIWPINWIQYKDNMFDKYNITNTIMQIKKLRASAISRDIGIGYIVI